MHWKALFDYKHLGCHDLPRDANDKVLDLTVSIKTIAKREIIVDGGRKDKVPVAELIGAEKPMIFNKTNLKTLEELFDSTELKDFIGKPFTLYAARVEGKAKKIVDGLRIRNTKPIVTTPTKPELTPTNARWDGAKKAVKEGITTVEAIKQTFSLSPENEALLLK